MHLPLSQGLNQKAATSIKMFLVLRIQELRLDMETLMASGGYLKVGRIAYSWQKSFFRNQLRMPEVCAYKYRFARLEGKLYRNLTSNLWAFNSGRLECK